MSIQNAKSIKPSRLAPSCISLVGFVLGLLSSSNSHASLTPITSITGITFGAPNGGLSGGSGIIVMLVPNGGTATLRNNIYNQTGFMQTKYEAGRIFTGFPTRIIPETLALEFALARNNFSSPRLFTFGQTVDSTALWTYSAIESSVFKVETYPLAPDFGPSTYLGFRSGGNSSVYTYGYLEVTWVGSTGTFNILDGAYESVPGVPLVISTSVAAVPEPSTTAALVSLVTLAFAASRRRRSQARQAIFV